MKTAFEMHERILELEKRITALTLAKDDRNMNNIMSNIDSLAHIDTLDDIMGEYIRERNELYDSLKKTEIKKPEKPESPEQEHFVDVAPPPA